jgi:hypothetical protein
MELSIEFPPKRGKPASHVSMRGGVHYVPPDRESEFFRLYCKLVRQKTRLHLVEQCNTNEFKFFLDIDYKSPEALTIQDVEKLATDICRLVDGGKCLVLVANPKQQGDLWKSGIHMVWFEYIVDYEQAMEARNKLVQELPPDKDWSNILDTSVYKGGLRLPWSWKYNKKTEKEEVAYLPLCIITERFTIREVDQAPDEALLKLASVRMSGSGKREGRFSQKDLANSIQDKESSLEYEKFIRMNVPGNKKTIVRNIMKRDKYFIVDTNSHFCENKGGIHSGNRVYFVVDSTGMMYQKCFCRCDISRRKGFCAEFRGTKYRLPGPLWKKLFE